MRLAAPCLLWLALATSSVLGVQPRVLAAAMRSLGEQKSYSWEIINGDPGPVASSQATRRGRVTTVHQNASPHVLGKKALNGERLVRREWPDGLVLETFVSADGTTVTQTPEGWMTGQEVLAAMADEKAGAGTDTERYRWLRRADRPDVRSPDEELAPFLKGAGVFVVQGNSYIARLRVRPDGWVIPDDDDTQPALEVTYTLNLHLGVLRDFEVKIEGARNFARAGLQIPVNDSRLFVLTYVPITRLDVPEAARAKASTKRTAR